MSYLDTTTRSLAMKLDNEPSEPLHVICSFERLGYVSDKVKFFDPHPQVTELADADETDIVTSPAEDDDTLVVSKVELLNILPAVVGVGLYYVDDDESYLFKHIYLSPGDNLEINKDGTQVLNACGAVKTTVFTCAAASGEEFSTDVGNDTDSTFLVQHNLGTRDLVWSFRWNDSPYAFAIVEIQLTSTMVASVVFNSIPNDAEYRLTIQKGDFAQSFGNGVDTSFTIQHNLGTRDILWAIWSSTTSYSGYVVDVEATDANNITLSGFLTPPITNEYRVVVKKAGFSISGGFAANIGNGTDSIFPITHNQGTRDILPAVWEAGSPYKFVIADINATDGNMATVNFGSVPALNQYRFVMNS